MALGYLLSLIHAVEIQFHCEIPGPKGGRRPPGGGLHRSQALPRPEVAVHLDPIASLWLSRTQAVGSRWTATRRRRASPCAPLAQPGAAGGSIRRRSAATFRPVKFHPHEPGWGEPALTDARVTRPYEHQFLRLCGNDNRDTSPALRMTTKGGGSEKTS